MTESSLIRVLVVEDHLVARRGIMTIVNTEPDMTVVAEAVDGRHAVEQHRMYRPDVTLMDLRLIGPMDGVAAITTIRSESPTARIIALTTYNGDGDIRRALDAGVQGYLTKNVLEDELLGAIRAVHAGRRCVSSVAAVRLAECLPGNQLSERECEVLTLAARGFSNKRIGESLHIAETTVKSHVKSILEKLGADDRTQAVAEALRRGLIRSD